MTKYKLRCIGILKQNKASKFQFCVRWFIDDDQNDENQTILPNPLGKFTVKIRTKRSRDYLKDDGSIGKLPLIGDPQDYPVVSPMNYAMIDPPTITDSSDGTPKRVMPKTPIDPNDKEGKTGIGIYHILTDSDKSTFRKKLNEITAATLADKKHISALEIFQNGNALNFANSLSSYLLDNGFMPRNLQAIFVKEFSQLETLTFKNTGEELQEIPELFKLHNSEKSTLDTKEQVSNYIENVWKGAHGLSELFRDTEYLDKMETTLSEPKDLKSQLSLLTAQGAELIDYWCNPYKSQPDRIEEDCGKKYALADLLGLGASIGSIDKEIIEQWKNNQDTILINVDYAAPSKAQLLESTEYNWELYHDLDEFKKPLEINSTTNVIVAQGTNSLENTLNYGSSCPPEMPISSLFDYDLRLKRVLPDLDKELSDKIEFIENIDKGTGDGICLIRTKPPLDKPFPFKVSSDGVVLEEKDSTIITGINIYGIWEPENASSSLITYFQNPDKNPKSKVLFPWLISRRYSYHNDLEPFFSPSNANILALQKKPPISPAFQTPQQVKNLEKILHVSKENLVINETMPSEYDENDNLYLYSVNIREGFKNKYDKDNLLTWDKFPLEAMETKWRPGLWRGPKNRLGQKLQGYRFWVSSVDLFGQESAPIPVKNQESSKSEVANLFNFKYRATLQSPPTNDETKKDYITITYNNNKIKTNWESPFLGELGRTVASEIPTNLERHDKESLQANIMYLRKAHRPEWNEVEDHKLVAHIDNLVKPLPEPFSNEQWKMGLLEVLKHNIGWEIHMIEEGMTNTKTGNRWSHEIKIDDQDIGYDYMALMNFVIKESSRDLWTADDPIRNLHIEEQQQKRKVSHYEKLKPKTIEEFPSTGQVAFTESILVSDQRFPKLVSVDPAQTSLIPAKPVTGIEKLNRDLILSNILTTPDVIKEVNRKGGGTIIKVVVFKDDKSSDLLYTGPQDQMIRSALSRCQVPSDLDLTASELILRKEVTNSNMVVFPPIEGADGATYNEYLKDTENMLVASDLIGFRGIIHFKVNYSSIRSNFETIRSREAEALKYYVYQTRIPLNDDRVFGYSFRTNAFKADGQRKFNNVELEKSLELNEKNNPLFLIAICEVGYYIAEVTLIKKRSKGKFDLEVAKPLFDASSNSSQEEIQLIQSDQILEKEITLEDQLQYSEQIGLPVGGGLRELFIWTFKTSSAIGKLSDKSIVISEIYQSSILPPSPQSIQLSTINTQEEKEKFALEVSKHKHWLPLELHDNTGKLTRQPRNIIQWKEESGLPSDIYLAIEREYREEEDTPNLAKTAEMSSWELASIVEKGDFNIDGTNPEKLFKLDWLDPLGRPTLFSWLNEAGTINPPSQKFLDSKELLFIGPNSPIFDPKQQLRMATGLFKNPTYPNVYIDYFYDNSNLTDGMDTFRSYRYRLSSYIDIDPDGKLKIPNKYLYSRPSSWTEWIRPSFPAISEVKITAQSERSVENQLIPEIKMIFTLNNSTTWNKKRIGAKRIFYRIIVKRKHKNSIFTFGTRPKGFGLLEIDKIIDMPIDFKSGDPLKIIVDNRLEREDFSTAVRANYRIEVSVVAFNTKNELIIIRDPFVRDLPSVNISSLTNSDIKDNKEKLKTIKIQIL